MRGSSNWVSFRAGGTIEVMAGIVARVPRERHQKPKALVGAVGEARVAERTVLSEDPLYSLFFRIENTLFVLDCIFSSLIKGAFQHFLR